MNPFQTAVLAFHRAMEMPDGSGPFERPALRARLILEEAFETAEALGCVISLREPKEGAGQVRYEDLDVIALGEVDEVETLDGLADLAYVVMGCAVEMGVDLEPIFDEVQRSNMAKVGGAVREDGKRLKPAGWTPPDIKGVLARMRETLPPEPAPEPEPVPDPVPMPEPEPVPGPLPDMITEENPISSFPTAGYHPAAPEPGTDGA